MDMAQDHEVNGVELPFSVVTELLNVSAQPRHKSKFTVQIRAW